MTGLELNEQGVGQVVDGQRPYVAPLATHIIFHLTGEVFATLTYVSYGLSYSSLASVRHFLLRRFVPLVCGQLLRFAGTVDRSFVTTSPVDNSEPTFNISVMFYRTDIEDMRGDNINICSKGSGHPSAYKNVSSRCGEID